MQQDFRYHRSKFTQEQPRAYAVEGIAAISGTSAIVGDLIIGESNKVTSRGSTWRVRHGTAVILSGDSFA